MGTVTAALAEKSAAPARANLAGATEQPATPRR